MFSMSPTLNNSLQSLYNQYSGPQGMTGPGGGQWNPAQPLWQQAAGMAPQMGSPITNPALTGPALATSNAQLPGVQTQPAVNPNILAILQRMMSGTIPGVTPPPGTTPPTTQPGQQPGQQTQPGQRQPPVNQQSGGGFPSGGDRG